MQAPRGCSGGVGAQREHGRCRARNDWKTGGGFGARIVFGPQIIEYENGVDYAARLSKLAYFEGYTAIPLGNAPWSVCRRWANGVLKGALEGGRDRGPRKRGERQGAREDAQA